MVCVKFFLCPMSSFPDNTYAAPKPAHNYLINKNIKALC